MKVAVCIEPKWRGEFFTGYSQSLEHYGKSIDATLAEHQPENGLCLTCAPTDRIMSRIATCQKLVERDFSASLTQPLAYLNCLISVGANGTEARRIRADQAHHDLS